MTMILKTLIALAVFAVSLAGQARTNPAADPNLRQGLSRGNNTEGFSPQAQAPGCPCSEQDQSRLTDHTAAPAMAGRPTTPRPGSKDSERQ